MAVVAPATMIDYEKNIKEFFKEHLHEHEEIRLILGGGGAWILTRSFLGFCWCVNYAFFLISGWLLHWRRMYVDRLRVFFCWYLYMIDWQGMRTSATLMEGGYGFMSRKATLSFCLPECTTASHLTTIITSRSPAVPYPTFMILNSFQPPFNSHAQWSETPNLTIGG